jgi:hypothetical protein
LSREAAFAFCGFTFCDLTFCGFTFCGFTFCGFTFCGFSSLASHLLFPPILETTKAQKVEPQKVRQGLRAPAVHIIRLSNVAVKNFRRNASARSAQRMYYCTAARDFSRKIFFARQPTPQMTPAGNVTYGWART